MEVSVSEFPFVAELPKREVRKVRSLWEEFKDMVAVVEERGAMLPPQAVADLLGVSRQRILELVDNGRFKPFVFRGHKYIFEDEIVAFAESERKNGRPCGPKTIAEAAKVALKAGKNS
jgi:hypothetical protein